MERGKINDMDVGMHPLNWAAKLAKVATDVMFSVAVNDPGSVESRLQQMEGVIRDLRESIAERLRPGE